jgi:D-alanyl-D-alanine carboxypeptidase
MTAVSALSGYMEHPIFGTLIFSSIVNQAISGADLQRNLIDTILNDVFVAQNC